MSSNLFNVLASAALLAAPFLNPGLFPLAWVSIVPLFRSVDAAASPRQAALFGWMTGMIGHMLGFHWLTYTISVFGGFDYPVSALLFLAYAGLQGLQLAILAGLVKRCGAGPLRLFPAVYWVALEFWFPLLFPWYLANSQSAFLTFIQSADLFGPYGASFLVMWCNAIAAGGAKSEARHAFPWSAAVLCAFCVIASVVYGFVRLRDVGAAMNAAPKLSVAAVQANIPVGMKWDPKQMNANLDAHIRLSREIHGAEVVIWPESAVEEWLPENLQALPAPFVDALELKGASFIFGARSYRGRLMGPDFKAFNTAFLTDAHGRVLARYHKQVLLAFGEYIPFSGLLGILPAMPFVEGFSAGAGPGTLDLPNSAKLAPLICYEDLMPQLSRAFVRDRKANLLVNLTNDAWYGKSVAPWQHARLAQLRAIETRRALLRVTNTGVTAVFDAKGEMVQSLPIFIAATLQANVELLEGETFYVRFGDWFAWSLTAIALAIIAVVLKRKS